MEMLGTRFCLVVYPSVSTVFISTFGRPAMANIKKKTEDIGDGGDSDYNNTNRYSRMLNLLESGTDSDVTLIVGVGKERIQAHKIILTSGSLVFRDMFKTGQEEIVIPDVEPKIFKLLLKYIYTGDFSVEIEDAIPVLNLANIYKLPDLSVMCGKLLATTLSEKTVFTIFRQAIEFKEKTLEESSLQLICKHAYKYLETPQFLQLSSEHICKILSLDDLAASSEIQIFEAVIRWAKEECKRHQTLETDKYVRSYLDRIIPLIRFPQMTRYEFATVALEYNILTTEEIQVVGLYHNIPNTEWSSFPIRLFNPNPRNYHKSEFCILQRLTTRGPSYITSNDWHRICFRAEENAALDSIGLNEIDTRHGSCSRTTYPLIVTIKLEKEVDGGVETLLSEKTEIISRWPGNKNHHVKFNKPIKIMAKTWYTASLQVKGTYYGVNFFNNDNPNMVNAVKSDGTEVKFEFKSAALVKGGGYTTVINSGQMAEFGIFLY